MARCAEIDGMREHTFRGTVVLSLLAAWVLSAAACRTDPDTPHEIRIGLLALLHGVPEQTSGLPSVRASELAAKIINDRGGIEIDGHLHRVVIIVKDYEDRADSATSVARALINQEHIDALIGPQFSRHAIPVSVVADNARVPMLSPMSSNPATTKGKSFVFRLAFLDDLQGDVMGRFAANELGAVRAAVLYDKTTAYGRSLSAVFRKAFEEEGGQTVAFESYALDEPLDYRVQLSRIDATDPDVLYLPNDTERVVAQILQARELGIDAILLGGDTWDMEAFKLMPECDGAFIAHQWHYAIDSPEARSFVELYRDRYGTVPKVTAAMTFDAVNLLLQAIENRGSKDPDSIRAALAETGDYRGATGIIRFTGSPDPVRSVVISRIHEGETRLFRVVDP
ncbi:MAG: ABC transporter substrate-binding protein [Acidobacteriota bacterium]|nr:MAG: ABC transporter substrate-binding protein [Acidobacteriota bacterium]